MHICLEYMCIRVDVGGIISITHKDIDAGIVVLYALLCGYKGKVLHQISKRILIQIEFDREYSCMSRCEWYCVEYICV